MTWRRFGRGYRLRARRRRQGPRAPGQRMRCCAGRVGGHRARRGSAKPGLKRDATPVLGWEQALPEKVDDLGLTLVIEQVLRCLLHVLLPEPLHTVCIAGLDQLQQSQVRLEAQALQAGPVGLLYIPPTLALCRSMMSLSKRNLGESYFLGKSVRMARKIRCKTST